MRELNVYDVVEPPEVKKTIIQAMELRALRAIDRRQLELGAIDLVEHAKESMKHQFFDNIKEFIRIEKRDNIDDSVELMAKLDLPLIYDKEMLRLNSYNDELQSENRSLRRVISEKKRSYKILYDQYKILYDQYKKAIRPWYVKFYEWLWEPF